MCVLSINRVIIITLFQFIGLVWVITRILQISTQKQKLGERPDGFWSACKTGHALDPHALDLS